MTSPPDRALVLLSGGQDSTTCLFWAAEQYGGDNVSTISFDYGQRHRIELECARNVAEHAGVGNVCLPIDTFAKLGGDALTDAQVLSALRQVATLAKTFGSTYSSGELVFGAPQGQPL